MTDSLIYKENTMQIEMYDGKKPVLLRAEGGIYELCWTVNRKETDGSYTEVWNPKKWFSNVADALECFANLKISNSNATTLAELKSIVEEIKEEITKTFLATTGATGALPLQSKRGEHSNTAPEEQTASKRTRTR